MVGAHRSTTQNPVTEWFKSAAWLLAVADLITAPLAVLGLAIYLAIARQADLLLFLIALQGAVCMLLLGQLAGALRKHGRSPEKLMNVINEAGFLLFFATALLANIGRQERWMHGAYEYAFIAISVLYVVGLPVYWLGGKRSLMAALEAREANRQRAA